MKKICLLLVLTLLLSGCGQEPLPTETTVTEESTAPVETTETAGEIPTTEAVTGDHSYRGEDWESGYVITDSWGFFCPHMDTDVYYPLRFTGDFDFFLLSREPIDPDAVTITLGTEIPYWVYVDSGENYFENQSPGVGLFSSNFNWYIYASYQNWDWKKHKEMNYIPVTTEEALEKAAYDADWTAMLQEYEKACLTGEGVPQFYIYTIVIRLDESAVKGQKVITYMDVSWPGVSFRHEFGELRLHEGYPPEADGFPCLMDGIADNEGSMFINGKAFPYIGEQEEGMLGGFIAGKEVALLKGYAVDGSGEIKDVRLVYETDEGSVDMLWDENSKVWLDPGTKVEVWAKAGGPKTFWSVLNEHIYYCIEYECDGVRDVFFFNNHHRSHGNPFELWALYFDETNLRSYYDDYWWAD